MASVPAALRGAGAAREHFDLAAARAAAAAPDAPAVAHHRLALNAGASVDLAYRLATSPATALRAAGLALMRGLVEALGPCRRRDWPYWGRPDAGPTAWETGSQRRCQGRAVRPETGPQKSGQTTTA